MEVILLERIETLGQMGDTVKVKPGYARNYLLPQHKALRATEANKSRFEEQRTHLEADNLKKRQEAEAVAAKMDGIEPIIIRQAGDNGQLYGSVTARDIADALGGAKVKIERKQVLLDRNIKLLGLHPCRITLHPEVIVEVTLNVARSIEEAATQKEDALREAEKAAAEKAAAAAAKKTKAAATEEAATEENAEAGDSAESDGDETTETAADGDGADSADSSEESADSQADSSADSSTDSPSET